MAINTNTTAQQGHRLGFALDDGRRRDLNNSDPARNSPVKWPGQTRPFGR
jgi:hypothetical protein